MVFRQEGKPVSVTGPEYVPSNVAPGGDVEERDDEAVAGDGITVVESDSVGTGTNADARIEVPFLAVKVACALQ